MTALPERVWLYGAGPFQGWDERIVEGGAPFVPESRLLAAEADLKAAQELEQLHLYNLHTVYVQLAASEERVRVLVNYTVHVDGCNPEDGCSCGLNRLLERDER